MKHLEEVIINYDKKLMEANKEIERLKKENAILKQTMCDESLLINENALLKDIIKEVREMCNSVIGNDEDTIVSKNKLMKNVLEILEKESKE